MSFSRRSSFYTVEVGGMKQRFQMIWAEEGERERGQRTGTCEARLPTLTARHLRGWCATAAAGRLMSVQRALGALL